MAPQPLLPVGCMRRVGSSTMRVAQCLTVNSVMQVWTGVLYKVHTPGGDSAACSS